MCELENMPHMWEDKRYRLRLILICIAVLLLLLAFAYDISHSYGKGGDAVSQLSNELHL